MTSSTGQSVDLELLTVCPPHTRTFGLGEAVDRRSFMATLDAHCAWADRLGATGMLVYEFWSALDPWVAAQAILARAERVQPVVGVLPMFTHPAVVARRVASLSFLYGRRVNLNVVAGAKPADIEAIGLDAGDPDRYLRVREYIEVVSSVLGGPRSFQGRFYKVDNVRTEPRLDDALSPRLFVPGSRSEDSRHVLPLADRSLVMAKPRGVLEQEAEQLARWGLRGGLAMIVGIIAREDDDEAWAVAERDYSGSRRDRLGTTAFAGQATSSQHQATFELARRATVHDDRLWYGAARAGIDCPKLVGSYDDVAAALRDYADIGVRSLVVDLPEQVEEYEQVAAVGDRLRSAGRSSTENGGSALGATALTQGKTA